VLWQVVLLFESNPDVPLHVLNEGLQQFSASSRHGYHQSFSRHISRPSGSVKHMLLSNSLSVDPILSPVQIMFLLSSHEICHNCPPCVKVPRLSPLDFSQYHPACRRCLYQYPGQMLYFFSKRHFEQQLGHRYYWSTGQRYLLPCQPWTRPDLSILQE